MKSTTRNAKFIAKGCKGAKPQDSFTALGGAQWKDVYKHADELNITIVSGSAGEIAAS